LLASPLTTTLPFLVFWLARTAYEKGFKVYTLKDCVAATSVVAQDATLEYNFSMFSVPTTSTDILAALDRPAVVSMMA
jgi:nicotinamidase-related amidase